MRIPLEPDDDDLDLLSSGSPFFVLRIPLELDDDDLDLLSSGPPFLKTLRSVKPRILLLPYTNMGETLFRISSLALILYVDQLALSLDQHIIFSF